MVNMDMLRSRIDDSGMTMVALAKKTGILRETLYNRMNGKGDFTASEIVSITKALRLTKAERDGIFFDSKVE